mmetsp:Transcript_35842/g.52366  ORF Transcript_35842/g.52366 Transcript_35842/m.52366 type:complete len:285 (+) Transcript_35842:2220-3074(+)
MLPPYCFKHSQSQILRFMAALSPRSVLTTGTGCSSAGLTCAAIKESGSDKEFVLEAGALVLADRGVCCIDEFGCIRPEDRTTIHEAMEQQTISVAKAGIVCKLNSRATVVAVMNARGALYEMGESVEKNTNIGSPLLSRFDLIFVMLDSSSAERDDKITSFLLNHAIKPGSGFETSPLFLPSNSSGNLKADGHSPEEGCQLEHGKTPSLCCHRKAPLPTNAVFRCCSTLTTALRALQRNANILSESYCEVPRVTYSALASSREAYVPRHCNAAGCSCCDPNHGV